MRPDVTVEARNGSAPQRLIVLDSKHRINEDLNAAMASIHMYRERWSAADRRIRWSGSSRRLI